MNKLNEHSPVPWTVDLEPSVSQLLDVIDADGGVVCRTSPTFGENLGLEPALGNARLMAAAPELLDALKGFVVNRANIRADDYLQPVLDKLFDLAEAAVAKATGVENV